MKSCRILRTERDKRWENKKPSQAGRGHSDWAAIFLHFLCNMLLLLMFELKESLFVWFVQPFPWNLPQKESVDCTSLVAEATHPLPAEEERCVTYPVTFPLFPVTLPRALPFLTLEVFIDIRTSSTEVYWGPVLFYSLNVTCHAKGRSTTFSD